MQGDGQRLPTIAALTGLRAFAAGWVVLYHFRADIQTLVPSFRRIGPFLDAGFAGVDIFFILSGFIISYTYLAGFKTVRPRAYGRFLWLRLARIYPVHLFTLAIFLVVVVEGSWRGVRADDLLRNVQHDDFWKQLLLVHAWETDGNHAWNYPAWSISSEWFAYLIFPLAALGLARVRRRGIAFAGFAASLALNGAIYLLIASSDNTGQIILPRIIGEFGAGCFLFILWRERWLARARWGLITPLAAAAAVAVTVWSARTTEGAPIIAAPLYALVIYGLAMQRDLFSTLLGRPLLVYAGEVSYALYMTHAVVQRFVWEYLPASEYAADDRVVRAAVLFSHMLLLVFVAVATYEFVERPARDAMRRMSDRRPRDDGQPRYVPGPDAPWRRVSQPGRAEQAPLDSREIG